MTPPDSFILALALLAAAAAFLPSSLLAAAKRPDGRKGGRKGRPSKSKGSSAKSKGSSPINGSPALTGQTAPSGFRQSVSKYRHLTFPEPWPVWNFREMGEMLEQGRKNAENDWRNGLFSRSLHGWNRLSTLVEAVFDSDDPRFPALLSRSARCQLETGDAAGALAYALDAFHIFRIIAKYRDDADGLSTKADGGGTVWDSPLDHYRLPAARLATEMDFARVIMVGVSEKLGCGDVDDLLAGGDGGFGSLLSDRGQGFPGAGVEADAETAEGSDAEALEDSACETAGDDDAGGHEGPDHADALFLQGTREERLPVLAENVARLEFEFGADHPDVLNARLSYLDCLAGMRGGPLLEDLEVPAEVRSETLARCSELLEHMERVSGVELVTVLKCRMLKAYLLHLAGRLSEAKEMRVRVADDAKDALGPGHVVTVLATADLGDSYAKFDLEKTGDMYHKALNCLSEDQPRLTRLAATLRLRLSRICLEAGEKENALVLMIDAANDLLDNPDVDPTTGSSILLNVGDELFALKEFEASYRMFSKARSIMAEFKGRADEVTLRLEDRVALALFHAGYTADANAQVRDALDFRRGDGLSPPPVGEEELMFPLSILGMSLVVAKGSPVDAAEAFRERLAILDRTQGPENPDTVLDIVDTALYLEHHDLRTEALQFHLMALERRRETLGASHKDTAESLEAVARLGGDGA
ncbi:MAG: hypothetical protein LBT40_00860 [Deltaproteobacteria bacterium]|nr:hypothetical protein [Deltaproteobacteria bacterium]